MLRYLLLWLLAGPACWSAQAQQPASATPSAPQLIRGQVLNEDGQPLPGATILLKGTKQVFSTNAEGFYTFPTSVAEQRVQVSLLGYSEAELSVRPGSPNAVTLQLLPGTRIKHGGRHHGKLLAVGREAAQ